MKTLGDKRNEYHSGENCYDEKDVKQFIKELKKEFKNGSMCTPLGYDKINELAGEDLV